MSDILIVDDERDIRELIGDILEDEGYTTRLAGNSSEAMAEINTEEPSLLLLDIWLKDSKMDGIDILKTVKRDNPDVPVVIISGHGNIEIAVGLLSNLDKVTKSNGRVLLSGPAGSGKEVAARYIHANSNRAGAPFVTVNCAGVAPETMEEVLFGRETPERGVEPGLLEQAHGGVVYFDEVADMPPGTQSKILRVLVDQQFLRVGGSDKVQVDLRVISSTNRDLQTEIAAGTFREELYHRLNVVPISVPSLEDRREDIPMLAMHFIDFFNQTQGLPKRGLSSDAVALLQTMVWPGNVRQLKNLIERVLILGDGNGDIAARELPQDTATAEDEDGRVVLSGTLATMPLREAREAFEREYLLTQINRFGGNISRTASFVGMERSALHRKLKSLGVVTGSKSGGRVAYLEDEVEEAS